MKKIFTLFALLIFILPLGVFAQCGAAGGNGIAASTPIVIDGVMADWTPILGDPDNNTYDGNPDLDAPISDNGRDIQRFATTQSVNGLYLYFSRAGSVNNGVDFLTYMDLNVNNLMETYEPVIKTSWSGSNGTCMVSIYNYFSASANGDPMTVNGIGDGYDLPGNLIMRISIGMNGRGAADGKSLEAFVPWSYLTQIAPGNTVVKALQYLDPFIFHISSINGNVSSVPGANSINDNVKGCYGAISLLPVHIENFKGNAAMGKITLMWSISNNETADRFEVERSADGKNFSTAGLVLSTEKSGSENYSYKESENTAGNMIYRLKMIDKNQQAVYSKLVVFQTAKTAKSNRLTLIGNPVTNNLNFSFQSASNETVQLNVYDMAGKKQMNYSIRMQVGENFQSVPMPIMKKGMYIVELVDATGGYSAKMMKN